MSGPANPFRPAEQVAPKVKCLVYGAPGVGKTYLALTAPGRIAVIDTEGGTAFYANRVGPRGLHPFDVLPTKTFAQVEQAIEYLGKHPTDYATLVIDPVTVLYETLQDAAQNRRATVRQNPDADLEMLDWQRIKRAYKRLMTDLVNLPMHVVVTARESEATEARGRDRVHVGWKPDAEKSTGYYFDTIVRLVPSREGRDAIVEKDRTGTHALNAVVSGPTFAKLYGKAMKGDATGERALQSDEEAARIDANTTMVAVELDERDELAMPIGDITRTGAVARGTGRRSDLEARQMPDGWHIGFRLELGDNKHIPQVVAESEFGALLFDALGRDVQQLYGQRVTVSGTLYEVQAPGRRKYHRLVLTSIAGDGWQVPAPAEPEVDPETAPAASDTSADAELDAIAEGLPA
jgi:hypothetical protein